MHTDFSKDALIGRYPKWKVQIEQGDFRFSRNEKGQLVMEWPNTSVFFPETLDILHICTVEGTSDSLGGAQYKSGIMSLIITVTPTVRQ